MKRAPIVAVAFLTESNLKAIGKNLELIYPIDDSRCFQELLEALDRIDRDALSGRLRGSGKPEE